jgi:tetratricopeptide (TPR) repeat protein
LACRRLLAYSIICLFCFLTTPALGAGAAGSEPATLVDPINDPWLSEQGPAVAKPLDVAREQVIAAWTDAPKAAYARAAALRRVRLELGLGDLLAPARVIHNSATEGDPEIYTAFARDLAPDVPAVRLAHASALAHSGDIGAATKAMGAALWTVALNLSAQLWLIENLTFLLLIVVLAASLGFISLSALQFFPHAAHDFGDLIAGRRAPSFARSAGLAALLLAPLALGEGVIGTALALFVLAFAYAKAAQRNMLVMAAVLLIIGLHPLAKAVSIATTLVEEDPVARSVMAVVAGTETRADVERLEAVEGHDVAAAHALVYRSRRYGLEEISRTQLEAIGKRHPNDGFVLAAQGNIEMRRGDTDAAISFYERATAEVNSPVLLFDLSQAYVKEFRMEEYEASLVRAQKMDGEAVAALSSLNDADLVADLLYPTRLLQDRFIALAMSQHSQFNLAAALAPGLLGERWFVTVSAFALAVLVCLLFANRFDHSSQCDHCGHRICTRCEETVWSEEICEDCHHLFQNPEETDHSLRFARLQALSKRGVRIDRVLLAASLLIPGVAGLAARRSDLALFGLLLFGWIATWIAWPAGVFEDPLLMGNAAVVCLAIPGILSVIGYGGILFASFLIRKNK